MLILDVLSGILLAEDIFDVTLLAGRCPPMPGLAPWPIFITIPDPALIVL